MFKLISDALPMLCSVALFEDTEQSSHICRSNPIWQCAIRKGRSVDLPLQKHQIVGSMLSSTTRVSTVGAAYLAPAGELRHVLHGMTGVSRVKQQSVSKRRRSSSLSYDCLPRCSARVTISRTLLAYVRKCSPSAAVTIRGLVQCTAEEYWS